MGDGLRRWLRMCAHGADADGDDPTRSDGEVLAESRWRHLRGRVRQGGQEDLHLLLHFRRERQEGQGYRCWWLYWRYWRRLRLWNAWRVRIRDARRLRNAADATNRNWIWIRLPWIWNWTIWIRIGHASHRWQRNRHNWREQHRLQGLHSGMAARSW